MKHKIVIFIVLKLGELLTISVVYCLLAWAGSLFTGIEPWYHFENAFISLCALLSGLVVCLLIYIIVVINWEWTERLSDRRGLP
jgi:uncharacterized membrane protein